MNRFDRPHCRCRRRRDACRRAPAFAHPGHATDGMVAGFAHPLFGLDHILAMLAVGIFAAQKGGVWRFAVPASFMIAMAARRVARHRRNRIPDDRNRDRVLGRDLRPRHRLRRSRARHRGRRAGGRVRAVPWRRAWRRNRRGRELPALRDRLPDRDGFAARGGFRGWRRLRARRCAMPVRRSRWSARFCCSPNSAARARRGSRFT